MNSRDDVREILVEMIEPRKGESSLSVDQIAARVGTSKWSLYDYCTRHDLPARLVAAVTLATDDHRLIAHLCQQCGGTFAPRATGQTVEHASVTAMRDAERMEREAK